MSDERQYIKCRNCKAFEWSGNDLDWGWCKLLPPHVRGTGSQSPDNGCWSGIPKGEGDE